MDVRSLLSVMLTLFCLMVCGYFCRKTGIITESFSKGLSRLIISVGQPMMIIDALNRAEYSEKHLRIAWQVTLLSFAVHALLCVMAFGVGKLLRGKDTPDRNKIFEFSLVFANVGFIGFPILNSVLGSDIGSFVGAFYGIGYHLFVWTWGILILSRGRDDIRLTPKKIFFNYGTIPCAIGVVLYLCKPLFTLPDFCSSFLGYLGGLCTPISVLVTGSLLATLGLAKLFTNVRLYLHAAIKLLLFPFLLCLLAKLAGLNEFYLLIVAAMAGVPSAATVTMLTELYGIEPEYAAQTVGMTSLLSTATLPLLMLFAQWLARI